MKLAIISHTEHYTTAEGILVGWSPTVNEINHLLEVFDNIVHLAMHYEDPAPQSTMAYNSDRIQFIPLPSVGGPKVLDKLKIIANAPRVISLVSKTLKQVDYFQLRTPTGIGVFLIPYLTLFSKRKGWYKYAGNWNQEHPPLGYRLQRFMLKHQSRKITINGRWENQPKHCITFENPCLTFEDIKIGKENSKHKNFDDCLSFCFVGRMEKEKGVERIIEAFKSLAAEYNIKIEVIYLVGEGKEIDYFKTLSMDSNIQFIFSGSMSRANVIEVYKKSHVLLLPTTASEGFPKVIAEAMAFGCIPLVSNLSSISQYITHGINGFLLDTVTTNHLMDQIINIINLTPKDYMSLTMEQSKLSKFFTFSYYNERIKVEILK